MNPVISHGNGFLESFGFVVYPPGSDRVDIAPILFVLGVLQWISVHFGRRGNHKNRLLIPGQPEQMMGAQ